MGYCGGTPSREQTGLAADNWIKIKNATQTAVTLTDIRERMLELL